ncbi:MAG: hypothetical protein RL648_60 [Verrucomicrobiota bacterium]
MRRPYGFNPYGRLFAKMTIRRIPFIAIWCVVSLCGWETRATPFGDPSGFLQDEQIEVVELDAGMVWRRVTGTHDGLPQVLHVVTVDLAQPNLNLKLLRGARLAIGPNQYHARSTVSQLLEDSGASLAINASFFDIGATQTPFGLSIDGQELLRTAAGNRTVLVFTRDKQLRIGNFTTVVLCSHAGAAPVINSVNGNTIAENSLHLYAPPWTRSPGSTAAFANGLPLTEVVVERAAPEAVGTTAGLMGMRCVVRQVRDEMSSVDIGSEEAVLVGSGTMREFLRGMLPGEELTVLWRITGAGLTDAAREIETAVAGSAHLVIRGLAASANTAHWNDRHPRSAVGVAEDQQRIVLVLVEGRMAGRAEGMSLHAVARLLLHLGAEEGLELDGGGSSALAARIGGENTLLSIPSGGEERYVPIGLGVMEAESSSYPFFETVRISASDREAILTWTTPEAVSSYAVKASGPEGEVLRFTDEESSAHGAHFMVGPDRESGRRIRLVAERDGEQWMTPLITVPEGRNETDEMPPAWWGQHFFGPYLTDGAADPDGDGYSNLAEYMWGTDPTRGTVKPRFSLEFNTNGQMALRFGPLMDGRVYRLSSMEWGGAGFTPLNALIPERDERGGALFSLEASASNALYTVESRLLP